MYWGGREGTGLCWSVLVCTLLYWSILVYTGLYWCVLVCTGLYWFILVYTGQETVVNALGLLLALLLLPVLEGQPWLTWLLVLLLMVAHLGANMAAVRSLCFPTLNRPRLRLALSGALRGFSGVLRGPTDPKTPTPKTGDLTLTVPSPEEINPREPLLPGQWHPMSPHCHPNVTPLSPQCPQYPPMSLNATQCPQCPPVSPVSPMSPNAPNIPNVPNCP
ncbi:myosin tail region-interacting protein MTI1-like [Phasianus colchicus]|uniref:myosin tail region-interacting protein MTI1-like n=1 Tax=Phasianus colchicus TaxID=9054 RepID=UPI00129DFBC3|nr:myosin tail region-interacting protein MTI1-like [Phasianus colchicus]